MPLVGRLDRYVGRILVGSWIATLLFVVFLIVVFDLLVSMNRYLAVAEEHDWSIFQLLALWGEFHVVSLPLVFVTVAPFVTVIASMFAISRLMTANEVVPMVFTGRSTRRALLPVGVLGLLTALAMGLTWEAVLPPLSRPWDHLARLLNERGPETNGGDVESIVLRSMDGRKTLMCNRYVPDQQTMEGVVMMDLGSQPSDLMEVRADAATWNPELADWELVAGELRSGTATEPRAHLGMAGVTPDIVWLSGKEAQMASLLSYSELLALGRLTPGRSDLVIAFHYHLTWPLANLVLLLLALPFAVHFERGSKIGRVVLAIAICGAYLIVDLTCQNLGRSAYLHPLVAAWTPTILFGSLGVVMFGGIRT